MNEELKKDIEAVLNVFVRPGLYEHGGGIEVLDLDEDGTLWVEMLGECAGCPSADETIRNLVQKELLARVPSVKRVEIDSGISDDIIAQAMSLMTNAKKKK